MTMCVKANEGIFSVARKGSMKKMRDARPRVWGTTTVVKLEASRFQVQLSQVSGAVSFAEREAENRETSQQI